MHIKRAETHTAWDRELTPVATLSPGEELTVETAEASGGQLHPRRDRR